MMNGVVFLCVLLYYSATAEGYSSGAPKSRCGSMNPGHGISAQQTTTPYTIYTGSLDANGIMQVTLNGTDSFKGFIIRGFKSVGGVLNENSPAGRFVNMNTNSAARIMPCNSQSSVTHSNGNSKNSVTLQWSPDCTGCQFYFLYTVVKNYSTMWVKDKSALVTIPA